MQFRIHEWRWTLSKENQGVGSTQADKLPVILLLPWLVSLCGSPCLPSEPWLESCVWCNVVFSSVTPSEYGFSSHPDITSSFPQTSFPEMTFLNKLLSHTFCLRFCSLGNPSQLRILSRGGGLRIFLSLWELGGVFYNGLSFHKITTALR